MAKFTKTTYTVEVLSEEPIPEGADITEVLREAETGDYVLAVEEAVSKELSPEQTADALYKAGSDPGFFNLDDNGNEVF